jgi:hypothetical protein
MEEERSDYRYIAERTGLQFIPLCSPRTQKTKPKLQPVVFDTHEMETFQRRGYDVPDLRYEQWVQMYHPKRHFSQSPTRADTPGDESPSLEFTSVLSTSSALSDLSSQGPTSSTPISSRNVLPHASFLSRLLADKAYTNCKIPYKRAVKGGM